MFIGAVFVIIFLSILILVHELGHFWAARKFGLWVEEFGFGLPPRIWSRKIGETIYSVNALPFGGFVKIYGENGLSADSNGLDTDLRGKCFSFKPIRQRMIILSAGVVMNFIFGWLLLSAAFSIGVPQAILITEIRSDAPAAQAGILPGDKVVGFQKIDEFVDYIRRNRGKEIILKIERGREIMEFKVEPRLNPAVGEGALGVGLMETGLPRKNVLVSLAEGLKTSLETTAAIFAAIFNLFADFSAGRTPLERITGPVGIVEMTAQAGGLGIVYLLQFFALISLNLAVINVFPFPALDGGRLIFLLAEKIKGSPLPRRFENFANTLGMAFLLLLMAAITIKDISKFF